MAERKRRERRPRTDAPRPDDAHDTPAPPPEEALFEKAVEEALAGLPFDEGAGFSYIFWRLRPGKAKEYCGRYTPPPDLDLWHRELGGGEYLIQVQRHGRFTDIPGIKLNFGDKAGVGPGVPPAPAPTPGTAGVAMQEILGLLKDRAAVEAAKAAIAEKQEGFGAKEMLELFAAFKAMTPDTLTQFKTVADLLRQREPAAPQAQRGPYDDVIAKMLTTVVERGITGGSGEPSLTVEIARALLNPATLQEVTRTVVGTIAMLRGQPGRPMPPAPAPTPAGEIPPTFREPAAVSEQPTTGEGTTGTPQRGFERLVQEILGMIQSGDRDFDHLAACADRWTPGLCEQIAAAEKEAAIAHIVQTVPPLNNPSGVAFLNEFYVYLKQQPEEGTDAGN